MHLSKLYLLLILFTLQFSQAESIVIANGEWPPYTSESLVEGGPYTRIVVEAFTSQGIETEVKYFPWVRSFTFVSTGQYAASPTWQPNDQRSEKVLFSDAVMHHDFVLFHKKGLNVEWNDVSDLNSFQIGVINGFSYGENFDQAIESNELNITVVNDEVSAFQMLNANRIDLFLSEINVGYSALQKIGGRVDSGNIVHHPKAIHRNFTSVIFSKNQEGMQLRDSFNLGLEALKMTNRLNDILSESGLSFE